MGQFRTFCRGMLPGHLEITELKSRPDTTAHQRVVTKTPRRLPGIGGNHLDGVGRMQSITSQPCAIALALKELQRCPINVCPDFVSTDHPMPATDGTCGQQKQNGRQGRSLGSVLALNPLWTAMQLAVPAPLWMRHQAKVLDQGLRCSHDPSDCSVNVDQQKRLPLAISRLLRFHAAEST